MSNPSDHYIETAIRSAAITLQWQASNAADDGNGYPITAGGDEYTDEVAEILTEMVTAFVTDNYQTLVKADVGATQAGHDFILTANHHGAGFWDRGLGDAGDTLTEAAHPYGEIVAEFVLWGDAGEPDHWPDEVAYLMVENTVIVPDRRFRKDEES